MRLAALACATVLALCACAAPAPPPSPATAAPVASPAPRVAVPPPSPTAATVASLAEDSSDVAASLLDSTLDVIDEAAAMSEASCDDLKLAQTDNPQVFRSVRGFAATLKRAVAQDPSLADDEQIKMSMVELDTAIASLDGALSLCGITP